MSLKNKLIAGATVLAASLAVLTYWFIRADIAVLEPKGKVASDERDLIIWSTVLMLVIVLPVFALTAYIAVKFREDNKQAKYAPEWDHNRRIELLWWALPLFIISILSVITWQSSHALDPFKPLDGGKAHLKIQAVALQYRWFFIYPEQGVASLNFVRLPADTPVEFSITSDAPMNSFWIPELGGQIYAMPGMTTKLHLEADQPGSFRGVSANISGSGFAGMNFTAQALPPAEFSAWANSTKNFGRALDKKTYATLADPSEDKTLTAYALAEPKLFDMIIAKYMSPGGELRQGSNHSMGASHGNH